MKVNKSNRRKTGNILIMIALVAGIVILALLVGVGLMLLFSSSSRGRNASDEMALGAAKVLNADDRQGRVNILVERSRELVFSARRTYSDLNGRYKFLEPIARQMVEASRHGAGIVEQERATIQKDTESQLSELLKGDAKQLAERSSLNVVWLKTAAPRIAECEFGTIKDLDSNVQIPDGYEELKALDLRSNFVNRQSRLYKGNIDALLPSPDDDLHFKISSLPAPVKRTISGARLMDDDKFQVLLKIDPERKAVNFTNHIPCAVKLKIATQVTASGSGELSGNVASSSVALTDGGTPAPDEEP